MFHSYVSLPEGNTKKAVSSIVPWNSPVLKNPLGDPEAHSLTKDENIHEVCEHLENHVLVMNINDFENLIDINDIPLYYPYYNPMMFQPEDVNHGFVHVAVALHRWSKLRCGTFSRYSHQLKLPMFQLSMYIYIIYNSNVFITIYICILPIYDIYHLSNSSSEITHVP